MRREKSVRGAFRALHLVLDVLEFAWDTYRWKQTEVESEEKLRDTNNEPIDFNVTV